MGNLSSTKSLPSSTRIPQLKATIQEKTVTISLNIIRFWQNLWQGTKSTLNVQSP